jgi:hypothetical protein
MRDHRWFAACVLGLTYASFSLLIGVSFWQGSRLHYPAEMAWSILVAYAIIRLLDLMKPFVRRLKVKVVRIRANS